MEDSINMIDYQIKGPDQERNYWYRGWRLEQRPCDEPFCGCGLLCWYAYPEKELNQEQFSAISEAAGMRPQPGIYLQRSVQPDIYYYKTIEECIDAFEAAVERQFRANLTSALREEQA